MKSEANSSNNKSSKASTTTATSENATTATTATGTTTANTSFGEDYSFSVDGEEITPDGSIDVSNEVYEQFHNAVKLFKKRETRYKKPDRLRLHGLLQQVLIGDCDTEEPTNPVFSFNFAATLKKEKWKAWKDLEGLNMITAMNLFIDKMKELNSDFPPEI